MLRQQGLTPRLSQGSDAWLVRIGSGRHRTSFAARSREEAQHTVNEIEAQRARGLMIDYTAARKITVADLVQRYIDEECPRHEGCGVEGYTLNSFLEDADSTVGRPRPLGPGAHAPRRRLRPRNTPNLGLEWLFKNLADVLPKDIEGYISERIGEPGYAPATVDRELDLISQIIHWARKTLRIHLHESPMYGVRRPRYFNERDQRLSPLSRNAGSSSPRAPRIARTAHANHCMRLPGYHRQTGIPRGEGCGRARSKRSVQPLFKLIIPAHERQRFQSIVDADSSGTWTELWP